MSELSPKDLSPFGQSALSLDRDFMELEALSGQLERLKIDSENGLERAKKILVRFGERGQQIGEGIQVMARSLDEARIRAEKAAQLVAARAIEVQERQSEADRMFARYEGLAELLTKVNEMVSQIQKSKGELTTEQREGLLRNLPEITRQLGVLSEEAAKLKEDARLARMKTLERSADSLSQSMNSIRSRLELMAKS